MEKKTSKSWKQKFAFCMYDVDTYVCLKDSICLYYVYVSFYVKNYDFTSAINLKTKIFNLSQPLPLKYIFITRMN